MDRFSVLMSCYHNDKPEYLDLAIQSVLESTIKPNEFIIVVDGVVPYSVREILKKYSKNNIIRIEELEKNVGLGSALKYGLQKCSNELVARMDSDDINRSDRFECQLEYFRNDDKLDICGTYIEEFSDIRKIRLLRKVPLSLLDIKRYANYRNPINHVTVMFKKSKIQQVGSYEKMISFEDYFLWLKCLNNNLNIRNIPVIGVEVRGGMEMIGRRSGFKYIKDEIHFLFACYKKGFLNLPILILNLILKIPLRVMGPVLNKVYTNLLRTKVQ